MKKIVLYGAGGHCNAVIELIRSSGNAVPALIYDDAPKVSSILGVPVQNYTTGAIADEEDVCITIGNNFIRKEISKKLQCHTSTWIHSSSVVYPSTHIGKGCQLLPGTVIDAGVSLGDFCIVNNNATVSHNVTVGSFSHIAINAAVAGGVTIGEGVLIGAGSVLLPGVKIGNWAVIGAGTVITKDVPDHAVVYGNPSKIIRYNKP
ncbi:MAG: acetyltransferase [Bacteroidota bacterium]